MHLEVIIAMKLSERLINICNNINTLFEALDPRNGLQKLFMGSCRPLAELELTAKILNQSQPFNKAKLL